MISSAGSDITEAKVVVFGSATVGKTSIIIRLLRNTYSPNSYPTIGAAFQSYVVKMEPKPIKMSIWDTSGSDKYRSMLPMYFRNTRAAVMVYDITSTQSFQELEYYLKDLKENAPPNVIVALIGNKTDLERQRAVSVEAAKSFADKHNIQLFYETSALSGNNVVETFTELATAIAEDKSGGVDITPPGQDLVSNSYTSKKSCCK